MKLLLDFKWFCDVLSQKMHISSIGTENYINQMKAADAGFGFFFTFGAKNLTLI